MAFLLCRCWFAELCDWFKMPMLSVGFGLTRKNNQIRRPLVESPGNLPGPQSQFICIE